MVKKKIECLNITSSLKSFKSFDILFISGSISKKEIRYKLNYRNLSLYLKFRLDYLII